MRGAQGSPGGLKVPPQTLQQLLPVQPPKGRRDNPPWRKVPAQQFSLSFTLLPALLLWSGTKRGLISHSHCGKRVLYLAPLPNRVLTDTLQCWGCTAQEELGMGCTGSILSRIAQSRTCHGTGRDIPPAAPPDPPAQPQGAPGASSALRRGKSKPRKVGKQIGSTSFRSAAPSWLRFAR